MIRANKYLVLKWHDVGNALTDTDRSILHSLINKITKFRKDEKKEPCPTFVCVRSTWPMYEETWKSIEKYVDSLE